MTRTLETAEGTLKGLLAADPLTQGMTTRARGTHIYAGRIDPPGPYAVEEPDDRIRFSHLGGNRWGLSVRRHTGRWERTPFAGTLEELVEIVGTTMQHLVA